MSCVGVPEKEVCPHMPHSRNHSTKCRKEFVVLDVGTVASAVSVSNKDVFNFQVLFCPYISLASCTSRTNVAMRASLKP